MENFKILTSKTKTNVADSYKQYIEAEQDIKRDPKQFWTFIKMKRELAGLSCNMIYNNRMSKSSDILVFCGRF